MNFPPSTAVNSTDSFSHGTRPHVDLSTIVFGDLNVQDREYYEQIAANILLDAAEPPAESTPTVATPDTTAAANPVPANSTTSSSSTASSGTANMTTANPLRRKRLWYAPGGIGHEEDENAPAKRQRLPSQKAKETMQSTIPSPDPEVPGVPKKRATRANNGRKRGTVQKAPSPAATPGPLVSPVLHGESPDATTSTHMMSGGPRRTRKKVERFESPAPVTKNRSRKPAVKKRSTKPAVSTTVPLPS